MTVQTSDPENLHDFALLALALAHGVDDHLSAFELEALADRLFRHNPGWSQQEVTQVVQGALAVYAAAPDRWEMARAACLRLARNLDDEARRQALDDLMQIARADGVVHESERQFVARIAAFWQATGARVPEGWTLLHDLAYLYVSLALGTDHDLSDEELQRIRQSMSGGPLAPPDAEQVPTVLREAVSFYAQHPDAATREAIAERLREALTAEQRTDALTRLVEIANADGRFLDAEEDLLNALAMAWSVDPGVLFGRSGVS